MKRLKQQVNLDENQKISSMYNKIPSVFHQHHYLDSQASNLNPIRNFLLSPPPKDINQNFEMINAYTTQSSCNFNNKSATLSQEKIADENKPIYQTPIKDSKNMNSIISTTLPTPINFTFNAPSSNTEQQNIPEILNHDSSQLTKAQKKERKLMIVDEWALNTETEIKKSIIVSEFFKMILEDEIGLFQDDMGIEQRAGSSFNHLKCFETGEMFSARSVLSRSTKSPVKRNYTQLD